MRCMPHTVHLAAIKVFTIQSTMSTILSPTLLVVQLLEGIGAISSADGKKAAARSGNYQDNITTPLGREHDDDKISGGDNLEEEPMDLDTDSEAANGVLSAIVKVLVVSTISHFENIY